MIGPITCSVARSASDAITIASVVEAGPHRLVPTRARLRLSVVAASMLIAFLPMPVKGANPFAGEWLAKGEVRSLSIPNSWWFTCAEEKAQLSMYISGSYEVFVEMMPCGDHLNVARFKGLISPDGTFVFDVPPREICPTCSEVKINGKLSGNTGSLSITYTSLARPTAKLTTTFTPGLMRPAFVKE